MSEKLLTIKDIKNDKLKELLKRFELMVSDLENSSCLDPEHDSYLSRKLITEDEMVECINKLLTEK